MTNFTGISPPTSHLPPPKRVGLLFDPNPSANFVSVEREEYRYMIA